jgi:hypothetical protein
MFTMMDMKIYFIGSVILSIEGVKLRNYIEYKNLREL